MPIYEFRCAKCAEVTSKLWRSETTMDDVSCSHCGHHELTKVISRIAVHRDTASHLDNLDPKYDKMVDRAIRNTPEADPNRHLSKMKPFINKRPLTE